MRVLLGAAVAVCAGLLAAVSAGTPTGSVEQSTTVSWCERLASQPAYDSAYQGADVHTPDGVALLAELDADGVRSEGVCRVLVEAYLAD